MNTKKLKKIFVDYRNPNIIRFANIYDCQNTVIDLREEIFKPVNIDTNTIKFLDIKFKRII